MATPDTATKVFMTGGTGHVGSVIIELAVQDGLHVRALSRNEDGDEKLKKLGAEPVRGDLHSFKVLSGEAGQADIVMHLADSFLDRSNPKEYDEAIKIDIAATHALAEPLRGTSKPLIVTSGSLVAAPNDGKETNEESPRDQKPFVERFRSEESAMSWADKDVKVICIRLAPFTYGRGRSGIYLFLAGTLQAKQAVYVGDGHWPTSTVYVDDAARLYLLAAQKAEKGDIFNATSQTDLTLKQIMEAMAAACDVPAISITEQQGEAALGSFLVKFLTSENRASSAKAQKKLGWTPTGPSLMEELTRGSYYQVARNLKEGEAR